MNSTTNDLKFPPGLKDNGMVREIAVPVEMVVERDFDSTQIDKLAEAGSFLIRGSGMKFLRDLGLAGEQLGALRQYKGGIFIGLDGLTRAISRVTAVIEDDTEKFKLKDKLEAGRLLAYLVGQLSKLTSGAVKMERDVAEVNMKDDQIRRQSLQPGQAASMKHVKAN